MNYVVIRLWLNTHFSIRNTCRVEVSIIENAFHHDGVILECLRVLDISELLLPRAQAFVQDILQILAEVGRVVELGLDDFYDPVSCLIKCFKCED